MNELCNIYDGTHQTPNYKDSGIMFLSVENIKDLSSNKYISYEDFKKNFKVYPEKNDILMTRIGDIGTTNIVKENSLKAYYVSLALLKCRSINPYYLNFAIKSDYVQNGLKLRSLLTAIPMKINKDQIGEVDINYPIDPEEQSNIGKLFDNLDNLITLHQRKFNDILVYKLRKKILFLKFTKNVWEQRKLANLINEYKETVTSDCTLPVLTSSKVDGVVLQEEHFGRKQNHDITGYNILPYGYCTYRNRSDGIDFTFNINKCCKMGIISKFYPVFYGNKNNINLISIILNNSKEVAREIGYTCSGTGQKVLSFLDLQKMNIIIPNRSEQDKISDLFDNLDNLITLHHRKYTYIFYSWEQRKLGDLMDITSVKRIHQSDWTESGIRFLRARDIVADYKKEEVEDKLYISKEKYEEYSLISGKVQIGDLLVTGVGTIGIPYLIRNNEPIYFKDGNIIWFKNNNKIDDNFLYYSFVGSKIQNFINEKSGVGTVGTYTIQSGKETPIMLTSNNEQRKISNLMSNLDNLITLHQHKELKRRNDNNEHLRW